MATEVGTLSTKGQVTIPKDVRAALRLRPGDKVLFDLEGGDRALVRKAEPNRLLDILDRLGPAETTGVDLQRRLRREWSGRTRRH
ncbi:MAG: AbrB/MazE/SpoVT family DNA-binding domain-containing protein [Candidatus Thermoplasmatota archaeon]|jgi:AbrB family looped-hinge helix DNA binding protein|nr:AbrB/MazE/SpoVT family DNA-binding domain-containing protein [Candidatus Thermoplasmatota archaeon]MCL5983061.1 AbrB/MazE/SpoVT family DNA-binding domain-containing protein [Candidatus Thermoplasmatota archaeon]